MIIAHSFEIRGPFRSHVGPKQWVYELLDDGEIIADIHANSQQEALENALLLAAAPSMADVLGASVNTMPYAHMPSFKTRANAFMESQGVKCEACDTLGQPSRMIYSSTGRPYHPTCVPDDVKRELAEMEKAEQERP